MCNISVFVGIIICHLEIHSNTVRFVQKTHKHLNDLQLVKTFSLLVCGCYLLFTERIPQDLFNFSTARNIVILGTLHSRKNQLDFAPSSPTSKPNPSSIVIPLFLSVKLPQNKKKVG